MTRPRGAGTGRAVLCSRMGGRVSSGHPQLAECGAEVRLYRGQAWGAPAMSQGPGCLLHTEVHIVLCGHAAAKASFVHAT